VRKIFLVVILIVIVLLLGVNVYLIKNNKYFLGQKESNISIPPVEASQLTSVDSPDGKLTLAMKVTKNGNGITYSFSVSGKEIFTKTVDLATTISIPGNSWSPNNKYIFLKEENIAGTKFFALSATTASLSQSDQTANITDLFTQKYPDFKISDVTGWGGINLIIINSVKSDGNRGPSFWFEVPGKLFIQLSTLF
jgi:hypothetical protein